MSALGQDRALRSCRSMSAIPLKADIQIADQDVGFVPEREI
jgi:hypothetical protein